MLAHFMHRILEIFFRESPYREKEVLLHSQNTHISLTEIIGKGNSILVIHSKTNLNASGIYSSSQE